ncbi:MAG: DUF2288 domain-containing protein [Epsilonproteobacteria bacterium]|nr:MAG: DUF2288 domain-containing protein [Campylobacterota bacterium]
MSDLRKQLNEDLDVATWDMLETHLKRGALVEVHESLELVDVGMAVAEDKADLIKDWMEKKLIKNISEEVGKDLKFKFLILSPYVLIQVLKENH